MTSACCRRVKVPHIGWNQIELVEDCDLFDGIPDGTAFYFVHSYVVVPARPADVLTTTEYGVTFASGVARDNLAAFQFHPEKSSTLGLRLYENFARGPTGRDGPAQEDPMRLFPAIDIQNGRCVRLRRGDFADETVFGDDPVKMAEHWVAEGARFLHVVDLDGARTGDPRNSDWWSASPRRCRCRCSSAAACAPWRCSSGR